MTALYRISIDAKTDATVRGRFHMINPDAGILPDYEELVLEIMLDAWQRMKHDSFYTGDGLTDDALPVSAEEAAAIADEHELREVFESEDDDESDEVLLDRFEEIIESAEVSEPRNTPAFWEAEGFWDNATDDDFPEDVEAYPYVEFTFTAHNARHVAHLLPGTHWATAQYCD
ncbi:hypothetical protein SAMN02982929_04105 [Saccharopolyspora kobensis]|uniref:Uncharacterized protein n=1 Tax=Saccharopolyspora kobensis TaxID=146035 RepID=A0A1H6DB59_9PSEU|nr:hypothetical protein [Saccharopolyspora kobensis]SEG82459.1 hypothetical protein SAMN02982929_04105 [Saccharopolyspora kobensis]SFE24625.1 hypothetical protein SAMN05216506_11022 [Saccharopolyspora kobensis]